MSTRANIIIKDAAGEECILYHHCDGYPEGVGIELQRFVRHVTDDNNSAESLARFIMQQDAQYEPTEGIHGDIEYLYTINTSTHELHYEKYIFKEINSHSDGVIHPLCTYQPIIGTKKASNVRIIRSTLSRIEKESDIHILYAVESGSRACGFASKDSDYDIRFIYVHKPEWYLKVNPEKDVIERNFHESNLDIVGWDLRKTLSLFQKTNPSLSEWLHSPVIYMQDVDFIDRMWQLEPYFFNPIKAMYHYLSIARNHDEKYLQTKGFTIKRFLYYLRGLLACNWIERYSSMPPVNFNELVDATVENQETMKAIKGLLAMKRKGKEFDESSVCQHLIDYTARLNTYYTDFITSYRPQLPDSKGMTSYLDKLLYRQATKYASASRREHTDWHPRE